VVILLGHASAEFHAILANTTHDSIDEYIVPDDLTQWTLLRTIVRATMPLPQDITYKNGMYYVLLQKGDVVR
jgi:hypothetical protein